MTIITTIINKIKNNFALGLIVIPLTLFIAGFALTALLLLITGNISSNSGDTVTDTMPPTEAVVEVPLVIRDLVFPETTIHILQVASFSSEEGAKASVDQFKEKDMYVYWTKSGTQFRVFSALSDDVNLVRSYRETFIESFPEHNDAFVIELTVPTQNYGYTATEEDAEQLESSFESFYITGNSFWLRMMGSDEGVSTLIDDNLDTLKRIVEILEKYNENIDTKFTKMMRENYDAFLSLKEDNASMGAFMAEFSKQLLILSEDN